MNPVYGPDGKQYRDANEALAAGVTNYTFAPPVAANAAGTAQATATAPAAANIPNYGFELARLMQQYGVNSPVAPKTNDQSLIDQYFQRVSAPQYQQPTGNALYNQYLGMGLGTLPNLGLPMASFFGGQAVCPEGQRYDPVTTKCVSVTDPGGVASAGRITTGTPNIGGNQCPPGFNFDPVTRSCVPTPETGLLTGGQSQSAQQPMPTCPPNTTLDPVNRICVPKGCPAGYEEDVSGNCVAKSMQVPCPSGFTRDATGVCLPSFSAPTPTPTPLQPCMDGYVRDASGSCVPDPDQLAFFRRHFGSADAGEYDIYNAIRQGNLSQNLVRDLAGADVVDQWLAKNVDPDKSFSQYAIQNLAAQGDFDDPNLANRGSQRGANRVFDLYQQGAIGLSEIEDAMGKEDVKEWMRVNQPEEFKKVYGFAKGGSVDFDKLVNKYQAGGPPSRVSDFNAMLGQAPVSRPPMMPNDELNQMAARYSQPSNAQQQYQQAAQNLRGTIESMSRAPAARGPSKAELYFRLASAFATPTPTGNFFEGLGLANRELAGYEQERRAAESATAERNRNLALELGRFDVEQAGELIGMERDQEQRDRTREYQERSLGMQQARIDQTDAQRLSQAGKMNATEMRMLDDAENMLLSSNIALDSLNIALQLSPSAYTKSIKDIAQREYMEVANPSDEKVVNTSRMEQLIKINGLQSLKMMFGGNPTEGERAELLSTQGMEAKSVESRNSAINEMIRMAEERKEFYLNRIRQIKSGEMRSYGENPTETPEDLYAEQPIIESGV